MLSTHILPTDPRYPKYFGCGVVNAKKALLDDPPPTGTPVNHPPLAVDDSATTLVNTLVTVDVLANDTDADGDTLSVTAVATPAHGTAAVNNGKVDYTPANSYVGSDTFDYTVSDGNGGTDTGTVNVTVNGVNHPPVAVDDTATTVAGTLVAVNVVANDTDVDGDTLSVTGVTSPAHGTAVINSGKVNYTPSGNYTGSDTFDYTVSDGHGGTDTGTVTVTITPPPNRPPVANDDQATTAYNTPATIDVLANDTDADADTLSLTAVTTPAHGATAINNGKVNYAPATNYFGADSFDYTVSDGHGGTDTGTVNVTVMPPPDHPPVALDDNATTTENTAVTLNLVANDTDVDADPLSVSSVTTPGHGTATIVSGKVKYTPTTYYTGSDTFDYTVSDGRGGTDTGTVSVIVSIPTGPTLHVADLDNVSTAQKNSWTAVIKILVYNGSNKPVGGVNVTGATLSGKKFSSTTITNGTCQIIFNNQPKTLLTFTFTIVSLTKSGSTYVPAINHDPDADSDGTTITFHQP